MMKKWVGLKRYASVRRQGVRDGKEIDTTTFYVSSEPLSAWRFAQIIRNHRKIENTNITRNNFCLRTIQYFHRPPIKTFS